MWARVVNIFLGLWLMVAPSLLGHSAAGMNNGHIIGPVIVTFAFTALWEATRGMRRWNIPLALWLLLAPWILSYDNTGAIISDMLSGLIILLCALYRGKLEGNYGGGWESLWQKNPLHWRETRGDENKN